MLILQSDSREQLPLDFSAKEGIDRFERIALPYGDYGAMIDGRQVPIFYERKSIGDLWNTMTSDNYQRFKREMKRATDYGHKLILITEGTYSDIQAGYSYSDFSGDSMLKKLAMLEVKYDLQWVACESRCVMARKIADTFLAVDRYWKRLERETSK